MAGNKTVPRVQKGFAFRDAQGKSHYASPQNEGQLRELMSKKDYDDRVARRYIVEEEVPKVEAPYSDPTIVPMDQLRGIVPAGAAPFEVSPSKTATKSSKKEG